MGRRIFLAAKISDNTLAAIRTFKITNQMVPIRWTPQENMHITLVPPWQSDKLENDIQKIKTIQTDGKPILVSIDTVVFGPNQEKPRLLWANGKAGKDLLQLKSVLEKSLKMKPKYKAFVPHITLGRFKKYPDRPIRNMFPMPVVWEETITAITLFESHLSPKGASYSVIEDFPL